MIGVSPGELAIPSQPPTRHSLRKQLVHFWKALSFTTGCPIDWPQL